MNYLTLEEIKVLNKKLDNLKNLEIPKIKEELSKARKMGDLSENSEYIYAKKKKFLIENEIEKIEKLISGSEIIKVDKNNFKKIILKNTKNNKIIEYNIDLKKIDSINLKILNLVKNKKIGDKLKIKKYNKEVIFEIISK